MTITADAPAKASPGPRRRGFTPLTPMRSETAKSIRKLAAHVQGSHPDMSVHQHLRDAAKVLESGNEEGAQRHLRAAMFALTPQSLLRNGVHDDPGHLAAREAMHGVHRHLLLVKDITDAGEKNRAAIARDSYGDLQSAPSLPSSPVHADPNAGYGPGALAQKPTARQPGGDRALNAPDRTNSGGSDPAVADPVGPQPKGSKQFARSWDEVSRVVELAATLTKAQANYRPGGQPGHRCGDCTMIRGDRCTLVEGMIDPGHVCDRFDLAGASLSYGWDEVARVVELAAWGKALDEERAGGGWSAATTAAASQKAHDTASATAKRDWVARGQAASLHGTQVRGRTAQGNVVAGQYDHNAGQVLDKYGGRTAVTHVQAAPAAAPAPLPAAAPSSLPGNLFARTWDDLASVVELSARTAALEVTPAPRGKPGGPGLYDVKDLQHTPYFQNLVKALIEKRGMPPGRAYAVAYGALRKWSRGGGHVHGEVRAAAAGALAGEKVAATTAKAIHGHATSWDDVASVINLAAAATVPGQMAAAGQPVSTAKSANATAQPRVGAGSPSGGQFAPAGSGGGGKQPDAHQKHVQHLQHLATHGTPAQQTAAKALLARMATKPKAATAPKATASKTAASKTAAKTATAKASSSKTASTTAKAKAHQSHLAHVAHLQHLATHGNPAQQKAAAAVLTRLDVKA